MRALRDHTGHSSAALKRMFSAIRPRQRLSLARRHKPRVVADLPSNAQTYRVKDKITGRVSNTCKSANSRAVRRHVLLFAVASQVDGSS